MTIWQMRYSYVDKAADSPGLSICLFCKTATYIGRGLIYIWSHEPYVPAALKSSQGISLYYVCTVCIISAYMYIVHVQPYYGFEEIYGPATASPTCTDHHTSSIR